MTFSKSDLSRIKWSLVLFLIVLAMSGAAIWASEDFVARVRTGQRDAQSHLMEARRLLSTATEDRENMKTYTLEYGRLLHRNIIGTDQRLDWMEGLDKLQMQNRVLNFKYAISPQQAYVPSPPVDSGNFELGLSAMTMHFDLLHEGQLINFLDALRRDIKGWYILDHCSLERTGATPDSDDHATTAAQLKAECAGGWLTLKNRNAQ